MSMFTRFRRILSCKRQIGNQCHEKIIWTLVDQQQNCFSTSKHIVKFQKLDNPIRKHNEELKRKTEKREQRFQSWNNFWNRFDLFVEQLGKKPWQHLSPEEQKRNYRIATFVCFIFLNVIFFGFDAYMTKHKRTFSLFNNEADEKKSDKS